MRRVEIVLVRVTLRTSLDQSVVGDETLSQQLSRPYVFQHRANVVVTFFQIFDGPIGVENVVPTIVNDEEFQFEASAEIEENVGFRASPILVLEVLFVLAIRVGEHIDMLRANERYERSDAANWILTLLNLAKGYSACGSPSLGLCCQW